MWGSCSRFTVWRTVGGLDFYMSVWVDGTGFVQEVRYRFRAGISEPAVCNKPELACVPFVETVFVGNPCRGNFSSRFSSHLRWPCYVLVSDPQLGDARTQLSLDGPQTPPTTSSGWKRMKTQILLERAVGCRRLLESFARVAGRVPDDLQALQSLANCTTLALEGERFEHVCASLRTEWSSSITGCSTWPWTWISRVRSTCC